MAELEGAKPIWQSVGVIGGAVSVLAALAGIAGYAVDPELQKSITELVMSGIGLVGGVVAVWGRIRATKKIG